MSIDKLDLKSPDLVNENFEKLAALFPNCVTEGAEGKAIDFDLLKQELSHAVIEGNKERYRLEWPGKREAIVTANLPTTKTLRPVREDSVDFDNTENLYIEGDNLEVLKLLQESYLGKVKMIYIDPPYNTGKDFVYKDNFSKDAHEELFESGQKDEYNQRLVANPETAGRYHSDWLSMMYPRLKLARNLLSNDGVIFISIDDSEVHNLRKISDEVFGDNNFLGIILWKKKTNGNNMGYIPPVHDYFLCYGKNASDDSLLGFKLSQEFLDKTYKNPDGDERGPWTTSDLSANHKGPYFPITNPDTGQEFLPPQGRYWVFGEKEIRNRIRDGRIIFGTQGTGKPVQKKFLLERKSLRKKVESWWDSHGMNEDGSKELANLFTPKIFDHPKPTITLKHLVEISTESNDTILDFFSGSSSSAHAVLSLNAEDNGNRKFIQVQISEETKENSLAREEGFESLTQLGQERIRRAGKKIKEDTGADIDYGFRVYRIDESNMQDVFYKPQDYDQGNLDLFADNVKPDRTADDLLAQVMLDWGLPLSLKIEQATISDKKVFKVAENSLYACFDRGIDEAFAKAIAVEKPLRIVFKDSAFKNDTAKTNVKQLLKQLSPETEMKVI
jgi:adenine-specific DNA-methyltransferase